MNTRHHPTRSSSEQAFLDAYDPTNFERLSVAVDVVLFTIRDALPSARLQGRSRRVRKPRSCLHVLLTRRKEHPSKGVWSLPGGFVGPREPLELAADRVLADKIGVRRIYTEQLYTFGAPDRDPRTRVISVAYLGLIAAERLGVAPSETCWAPLQSRGGGPDVPCDPVESASPLALAFDHADIIARARERIRGKLDYSPIGYQLLPARFTLRDLQSVHEIVLGGTMNKDAFRRRMLASGNLVPQGELESAVGHRPAEFYRFRDGSAL